MIRSFLIVRKDNIKDSNIDEVVVFDKIPEKEAYRISLYFVAQQVLTLCM